MFAGLVLLLAVSGVVSSEEPLSARTPEAKYLAGAELEGLPGLAWAGDLRRASQEKKLVFLEFTAPFVNKRSARIHKNIFPKPPVRKALQPYVLVMLHIDEVPEQFCERWTTTDLRRKEAERNYQWEGEVFETLQVPFSAILRPVAEGMFKTVAVFRYYPDEREDKFLEFLAHPMTWRD